MHPSRQFEGKVAFITGAASGIGEATAIAFADQGASVVVADIQEDMARAVVDELLRKGVGAAFAKCDVRDERDIETAIGETIRKFGRLDFAFNNAGTGAPHLPLAEITVDAWNDVMDTNLRGVWLCMKYQIPHMLAQGGGAIVNCSSMTGIVGIAGMAPYVAAKHGVIGLTKAAALDYATQNVRINAVCPGGILSGGARRVQAGMTADEKAKMDAAIAASQPIGRWGRPEEVADAVVWLCSPGASLMLGHALSVDGAAVIH